MRTRLIIDEVGQRVAEFESRIVSDTEGEMILQMGGRTYPEQRLAKQRARNHAHRRTKSAYKRTYMQTFKSTRRYK